MIALPHIIRQLTVNAEAFNALAQGVPLEQATWQPDPQTWSLKDVFEHLYNEEKLDFRRHLRDMFSHPSKPWSSFPHAEYIKLETLSQALDGFLAEREASLAWLEALGAVDWDAASQAPFAPGGGTLTLRAGDVLVSWAAHDYLHLRQVNELLYAWNAANGAPYSAEYAGGW